MKLARLPRGPTLSFKVKKYCLAKDVISSQKKRDMNENDFLQHPLLVMNNFTGEGMHIKLMTTMFQNMFPSINVNKVKLKTIRRCVLLNYDPEKKEIEFRHYTVRAIPSGVSRSVKKLIKAKVPNLARYGDVSEFFTKGDVSESEGEMDGPQNEVILPQNLCSRGNIKSQKSAIRLCEIGPRMTLSLVKIEEGVSEGNVLFHEFIKKTEAEKMQDERKRAKKRKLKADRKKLQESNVESKKKLKETNDKRSMTGIKAKEEKDAVPLKDEYDPMAAVREDIEYFKQEVGEDPEPELFPQRTKGTFVPKKRKFESDKKEDSTTNGNKKSKFSSSDKFDKKKTDKFSKSKSPTAKGHNKSESDKANTKKEPKTLVDIMRRSKKRKEQRTVARQKGKRANKPRNKPSNKPASKPAK